VSGGKGIVRHGELEADEQCLDAADYEKKTSAVTMYKMPMRL
jgi:hypothetical protein